MEHHTVKAMDEELAALAADVDALGALAVAQVRAAMDAFRARDAALAAQVAARDAELDERDAAIERSAIRFIALRQPMADDLRRPLAAMKTAMNLERCGDLAKNIAKRAGRMASASGAADPRVSELGELVARRLEMVMAAYAAADAQGAHLVWAADEEVDALHEALYAEILAAMATRGAASADACAHLLFIAKNLERIGDHATNIAELIHYQVTGAELRDRPKG